MVKQNSFPSDECILAHTNTILLDRFIRIRMANTEKAIEKPKFNSHCTHIHRLNIGILVCFENLWKSGKFICECEKEKCSNEILRRKHIHTYTYSEKIKKAT